MEVADIKRPLEMPLLHLERKFNPALEEEEGHLSPILLYSPIILYILLRTGYGVRLAQLDGACVDIRRPSYKQAPLSGSIKALYKYRNTYIRRYNQGLRIIFSLKWICMCTRMYVSVFLLIYLYSATLIKPYPWGLLELAFMMLNVVNSINLITYTYYVLHVCMYVYV